MTNFQQPTLNIFIPSLSSNVLTSTPIVLVAKATLEMNVPKEDPPKVEDPKSTPSTSSFESNACHGDDWGSLNFTKSYIGEYKVDPIHLDLLKSHSLLLRKMIVLLL